MFDENGMLKSNYLDEQKKAAKKEKNKEKNMGYTLCKQCGRNMMK